VGKVFEALDDRNVEFIRSQRIFFTASAPLAADGLVNLSPKGLDTFAVLDGTTVAYLDLHGSGIETVAHLRENGRITFLFCAFEGPPRLLRLYGRGEVFEPGDAGYEALAPSFPAFEGTRAIIRVSLERISDSCGYGVPRYGFEADRTQLTAWAQRKGEGGLRAYREENNRESIDGLPGLRGT